MTHETNDSGADQRLSVSRRTVVKGAAWSVPAIVIASQAPAMAASPPVYIDFDKSTACKLPGQSFNTPPYCYTAGYVLWARFVNNLGTPVYVRVDSMVVGGDPQTIIGLTNPTVPCPTNPPAASKCQLIPTGESTWGIFSNAATESDTDDVVVTISWFSDGCTGTPMGTAPLEGFVVGMPWTGTNGQGSCKFPVNTQCFKPPPTGRSCS